MNDINAETIRMRFINKGERVHYKVLFKHPMHTPFTAKDKTALYIKDIRFYHKDKLVMQANTSQNLSQNFLLQFYLVDAEEGDDFKIIWLDNLGQKQIFSTKVAFYVPENK